jgi:curved DNA-binding protein
MSDNSFADYYGILQVSPRCNAKTLEAAYRHLAKMYHPDHPNTADLARFNDVIGAYRVLRNPTRRAKYDLSFAEKNGAHWFASDLAEDRPVDETPALEDAEAHARILMFLYKKRREDAQNAAVIGYYLQTMLNCTDEHFEFHKWYLKEKGYIAITEQGSLVITIEGVDHVIASSRTMRAERLLIAQAGPDQD